MTEPPSFVRHSSIENIIDTFERLEGITTSDDETTDLREVNRKLSRLSDRLNLKQQPKGSVQFIHWDEDPKSGQVVISQFNPGAVGSMKRTTPMFRQKNCPYKRDANSTEAGFALPESKLLDQWRATAICGNDITSSIIYSAGLVAQTAGYYTPVCLLLVVFLLHFFRSIYVELVTALPLNGGTYTGLLNTTRKGVAVVAACLSFLSYAATVVVSATSAVEYTKTLWTGLDVVLGTVVVVVAFGLIMLIGIRESAMLAIVIFGFHMATLLILICSSIAFAFHTSWENVYDHYVSLPGPTYPMSAILFGFSKAMLGITGFESSANFVQEQKPGVFAKTLRNMWIIVAVVNPVVSILGFAVIPTSHFYINNQTLEVSDEVVKSMLALMGSEMAGFLGGSWLQTLVIVDAAIVLCGAVLTGYVGVVGLLKRMVADDIFPRVFLAQMPFTGANYPIVVMFCCVCVTLVLVTFGNIDSVSGVYTVAFLSVMLLFCIGNLLLKHTRENLKRQQKARWYVVILCVCALVIALVGNCVADTAIIGYAALYVSVFLMVFYGMFSRTFLLRGFLHITERRRYRWLSKFRKNVFDLLQYIEKEPVVFFSRRLNLKEMNIAVRRVLSDELTRHLTIVHLYESLADLPDLLRYNIMVKILAIKLY